MRIALAVVAALGGVAIWRRKTNGSETGVIGEPEELDENSAQPSTPIETADQVV